MNDLEERLKKLKPRINRKIVLKSADGRRRTADWARSGVKYLLACSCSFLLGLLVMYGVMKSSVSQEPAQSQPVEKVEKAEPKEKPSRFDNDSVAVRPREAPSPKIPAGESYTYLALLRKYRTSENEK